MYLFLCAVCACMRVCRKVSDPLELEFQAIVSYWSWELLVLWKGSLGS